MKINFKYLFCFSAALFLLGIGTDAARFIRYLRFENGILIDIFTGDKGY